MGSCAYCAVVMFQLLNIKIGWEVIFLTTFYAYILQQLKLSFKKSICHLILRDLVDAQKHISTIRIRRRVIFLSNKNQTQIACGVNADFSLNGTNNRELILTILFDEYDAILSNKAIKM
uniref:Uncharacterized protein n=1 Tax=Photinus pyralis TaxID=7054 RepID=A0A1Y1LCM6_PHOPY